jgi:hypothetical protein
MRFLVCSFTIKPKIRADVVGRDFRFHIYLAINVRVAFVDKQIAFVGNVGKRG